MNTDRPLLGIALMTAFCALAPLADSIAKILTTYMPVIEIVSIRFVAQTLLLLPVMMLTTRTWHMRRGTLALLTIRTLLHIIGISAMFLALQFMPIAEAIAIAFVEPFLLLLLGKAFLSEHIGPRRLLACTVGFGGAMMVIQPSFADVGAVALLPLIVAVTFAFYMLITRKIIADNDPISLQCISGIIALIILAPILLLTSGSISPFLQLVMPHGNQWALLAALAVLGTIAQLLMVWALRYAPTATLAPMQYLEIPFATLIGWIIFSDLPNGLAAWGIVVTMAAGLYIIYREHQSAR